MTATGDLEHIRTCPLCEAMCGLRVSVRDGRIARIRANDDDVWSRGYLCPKGVALGHLHEDPDRLRAPLVRRGDEWVEVGWDEAFDEVERLLAPVLERDGIEAVTAYVGNPTAHSFSLSRYIGAFMPMSGIPRIYSAGTVDQWPKNLVSALVYGDMWRFSVPDIDRTDYFVVMGANPHASQGSLLAAADVLGRVDAIRKRGGKVLVVDPRRTGTAERADEWLAIRPGTDAALLAAWINVLFSEGLVDLGHLQGQVNGVEALGQLCSEFSPERVADCCGISADTIRRVAREIAGARSAAVYGRIGTCTQEFGSLATWLLEAVNILTGRLDRPGGLMFPNPIAWSMVSLPNPEFAEGYEFGRWKSRVRGAPEVLGQVPLSCMAEEIATPGAGRIRALISIAGNPVLSAPDASELDAALPHLDCMVSVDNYLNETSRHAHVILPGLSPFEQPHYDELIWSWAVRNAGKYSPTLFEPPADRPAEWQILLKLAGILTGAKAAEIDTDVVDTLFFAGLVAVVTGMESSPIAGRDPGEIVVQAEGKGPRRLLDLAIRSGPWGDAFGANPDGLTLAKLEEQPNGIDQGAMEPRLSEVLRTESAKVELCPDYLAADFPRLQERLGRAQESMVLVSRRHVRSNNSWMHNVAPLVSGKERCTLLVHPDDASRLGLVDTGLAEIRSKAGRLRVPVEVSDEMMPGVVSLPHGWGHDRDGIRLGVASQHAGVCNNILAPGDLVDVPSGNAVVNGIPVQCSPVEVG